MPRKSAGSLAAAYLATGGMPPAPPADLAPMAAKHWRNIVGNFHPDRYADGGSQALLARFCRLLVDANQLQDRLDATEFGSDEWLRLHRAMIGSTNSVTSLGKALRLSTQAAIDRRDGRLGERVLHPRPWLPDGQLFGGKPQ